MARFSLLVFALPVVLAGCHAPASNALAGLWSRSDEACAVGAGVRFESDAVRVYLGRSDRVLFEDPRYSASRRDGAVRVTIDFRVRGDAQGERRRLTLERDGGAIRPVAHDFADKTTGGVALDLGRDEELARHFTLRRCPDAAADATEKKARNR